MKKVLFIDRDGTLVIEPPIDKQLDSLEKLEFYPKVFQALALIATELDYELVIVSNQDGLGTSSYPEDTFWPAHNKMMQAFENEGILFADVLIDRSFPEEMSPNRKPRTGMLTAYMTGEYDLANSFVIGDRLTDMELAANLGAKGIFVGTDSIPPDTAETVAAAIAHCATDWNAIYRFLKLPPRTAEVQRNTNETNINVKLNLDGTGSATITTGLGFFDHMLEQIGRHGAMDLEVSCKGDLHIDEHHTVEDTAIVLGEAFAKAIGNKRGMFRYGFCLPMDDCLAQVAIDFGGRPWIVWDATFGRERVGDVPTEMFFHFFKSFSDAAKCNLNIQASGDNEHHKAEAIFKAFAKAIRMAVKRDINSNQLPTTKGLL